MIGGLGGRGFRFRLGLVLCCGLPDAMAANKARVIDNVVRVGPPIHRLFPLGSLTGRTTKAQGRDESPA